jgi:hypothetical protein
MKKPRKPRGQGREAMVVSRELEDFDYLSSTAWREIAARFGQCLKIEGLRSLASDLSTLFPGDLPRLSKTENPCFSLIVKWFDKNWALLSPILPFVTWLDDSMQPITFPSFGDLSGTRKPKQLCLEIKHRPAVLEVSSGRWRLCRRWESKNPWGLQLSKPLLPRRFSIRRRS